MTRDDAKAAGLSNRALALLLGVDESNISKMLAGRTTRPTPGAEALVWLWPRLSSDLRLALLTYMRDKS
jgi:transcriptional regulator with XRE-family HTH domain